MQNFTTAPHRGGSGLLAGQGSSPNAALLIDFDNVTMGIRSDLTRQLKELLNSDIIKGKVAVQRAYADWRRYAQYIVPLSEASVDLIFAPAYGSSKKNATDIRLAIDALELVFTRPEIGTFILLSGDSDFSSLVLKLKEYGKYVIGVGLRESASDLLVQNCDEYFSYSSLTGLTRAGDEDSVTSIDAWELAERAVNQMAADADVMRSDRLKQVMVELDPTFDEGQLGFTKFNKFLTEAAGRNRIALKKLENGQYEVQPYEGGQSEQPREEQRPRGRGRRDRKDEGRGRESRDRAMQTSRPQPEAAPQPESRQQAESRSEPRSRARSERAPAPRSAPREHRAEGIDAGYELLRRAVRELTDGGADAARDSDVKRKMLELESGWDEGALGFSKFSRFLRQAHDAEVVDLTRNPEGFFEARPSRSAGRGQPSARPDRDRDREPGRERQDRPERGGRGRGRETRATVDTDSVADTTPDAATDEAADRPPAEERTAGRSADRDREGQPDHQFEHQFEQQTEAPEPYRRPAPESEEPTQAPEQPATQATEPASSETAATQPAATAQSAQPAQPAARSAGFGRRGRRGGAADGPPPLLPGQVVGGREATASGPVSAPVEEPQVAAEEAAVEDQPATPDTHRSVESEAPRPTERDGSSDTIPQAEPAPESRTAVESASSDGLREALGSSLVDPEALGLPTEHGAVIRYLSNSYQGVGQKTAEALIEAFGADRVFQGLNDQPARVKEVLGAGRRTDALLVAWQRDFRRRTTAGSAGDGGGEE